MDDPDLRQRSAPLALLAALRPRQWTKNLFVFAAVILAGELRSPGRTLASIVAFLVFCAVSSAVYLINDWTDVESDRLHPEKRRRPLAAGELRPDVALVVAASLAAGGLIAAFALNALFGWIVAAYLALQLSYSLALKHVVIVDVLAIAGGFVLRVLAGGAAVEVPISPYLYLSIIFLALFQGFSKRRHELHALADVAGHHRPSLNEYTMHVLDHFIMIAATSTIVTYSLYAITTPHRPAGMFSNVLLLTIPFVLYAVFRYLYLVQVQGLGGTPEEILLTDRLLLADVAAWGVSLLIILYLLPQSNVVP